MNIDTTIDEKIALYGDKGGIGNTIQLYFALGNTKHEKVVTHSKRVALLSEETARRIKKDSKAAFLGAIFHDIGKLKLPSKFFEDGVVINQEEYAYLKTHAVEGFEILKKIHPFSALCAGLHHAVYTNGYGIKTNDIPEFFGMNTVKDAFDTALIISVCDFIDAATHRTTSMMDKGEATDLEGKLKEKYHTDYPVVETALLVKSDLQI